MKSVKGHFLSLLIIIVLISVAWAVTNATTEDENLTKTNKPFVPKTHLTKFDKETIKNSINLYQNLSEDKKVAIKNKMAQLSQKRQQNIKEVEKQIQEYKLQKQLQNTNSQVTQIDQLQAIQKIALKENATETAKSLEILISWYQNKQKIRALDDNKLKVE